MSALTIDGVGKSFGSTPVLDGIHVDVEAGELVSLLGPSGCGKTTTLNVVAGFLPADTGRVLLAGKDVTAVPPYRRDTAVVFQNYALFPHLRVRDNVAYGLRARKLPAAEVTERVQEALRLMDIAALADRYPGQLSGGQQQRVAVARAVAVRPRVLLMDEPLSNLDAKLRQEIRLELRALQQRLEQAVLFVTHDQEEALSISDRIAVLNAGRVEQVGSPAEVFEHPRTVFVADFMGVENIFPGEVVDGRYRTADGLELPVPSAGPADHVGIRPSAVRLGPPGGPARPEAAQSEAAQPEAAQKNATVTGRVYLGDSVRYHLELEPAGVPVVAEQPRSARTSWQPGDVVTASFAAEDLLPLQTAPAG
jgi:ABC-type Fe3+/spermidine/putrescine transport system ATPase subunit